MQGRSWSCVLWHERCQGRSRAVPAPSWQCLERCLGHCHEAVLPLFRATLNVCSAHTVAWLLVESSSSPTPEWWWHQSGSQLSLQSEAFQISEHGCFPGLSSGQGRLVGLYLLHQVEARPPVLICCGNPSLPMFPFPQFGKERNVGMWWAVCPRSTCRDTSLRGQAFPDEEPGTSPTN